MESKNLSAYKLQQVCKAVEEIFAQKGNFVQVIPIRNLDSKTLRGLKAAHDRHLRRN